MQFDPNDTTCKSPTQVRNLCPHRESTHKIAVTLATACTWCVVECACGVICACLPTLRPLAKKVSSQFGSTQNKSRTTKSGSRATELVTIGGGNSHMNSRAMTKSPFQKLGSKDGDYNMYPGEEDLSTPTRGEFGAANGSVNASGGIVRTTEVTLTTSTHGYASSGDSGTIPDRTRSHGVEQQGKGFV